MIGLFRRWLHAPEPDAAERLGLFRIVFSVFYLWQLAQMPCVDLAQLPASIWEPVDWLRWTGLRPGADTISFLESALAGTLVLLAFGLLTRAATIFVLVVGVFLESFQNSFGKVEHGTVLLAFYLPLFFSASRWGDTWSIGALRRDAPPEGAHDGPTFSWPIRALQVVLAALFLSAAAAKISTGAWLRAGTLETILLAKNVEMLRQGLPVPELLTTVAAHPSLALGIQLALIAFEAAGVLLLARPPVREAYAATALVFHGLNALLLGVTFTPVAIAYAPFVDWPRLVKATPIARWTGPARGSVAAAVVGASGLALAVAAGWHGPFSLARLLTFDGRLDWRTIWYVLLPLSILWWVVALARVGSTLLRWPAR